MLGKRIVKQLQRRDKIEMAQIRKLLETCQHIVHFGKLRRSQIRHDSFQFLFLQIEQFVFAHIGIATQSLQTIFIGKRFEDFPVLVAVARDDKFLLKISVALDIAACYRVVEDF